MDRAPINLNVERRTACRSGDTWSPYPLDELVVPAGYFGGSTLGRLLDRLPTPAVVGGNEFSNHVDAARLRDTPELRRSGRLLAIARKPAMLTV